MMKITHSQTHQGGLKGFAQNSIGFMVEIFLLFYISI